MTYSELVQKVNAEWDDLENHKNFQRSEINGHKAVIVGVAHCGATGVNVNRKNNAKKNNTEIDSQNSGLDLMKKDWQKINRFIDELL